MYRKYNVSDKFSKTDFTIDATNKYLLPFLSTFWHEVMANVCRVKQEQHAFHKYIRYNNNTS